MSCEPSTIEQLEQFQIKTGLQRMDSTLVQSNIRRMSRLQLLVEIIHRFFRMLSEEEHKEHADLFAGYVREGKELGGKTLQSPDDEQATFRTKSGESSRGYVANITETCDDENELQLISRVSVAPNATDDQQLLAIACPQGQNGELLEHEEDRYAIGFPAGICQACPFVDQCPAKRQKKGSRFVLRITATDLRVAATRKQVAETGKEITNKRASVESSVRSIIYPFGGHLCKLPVRGQRRVTTMIVLSAMMVNIRRIAGYLFPEDGLQPAPDGYALG